MKVLTLDYKCLSSMFENYYKEKYAPNEVSYLCWQEEYEADDEDGFKCKWLRSVGVLMVRSKINILDTEQIIDDETWFDDKKFSNELIDMLNDDFNKKNMNYEVDLLELEKDVIKISLREKAKTLIKK